jgi:SET domain-containing protein
MIVLKPSNIEGIGCFTLVPIRRFEKVDALWDGDDFRLLSPAELDQYANDSVFRGVIDRYCVPTCEGWYIPLTFSRMSVGWYLNHSTKPNLAEDAQRNFVALRDIAADEELTIDYDVLVADARLLRW